MAGDDAAVAALLALLSSLAWGSADFIGGLASRRVGPLRVLAVSYPAGAVILTPLAALVIPGTLDAEALRWGLAAGVVGAAAMVLLYAALARGPMGIVSPLTAVMSAAIPVVVGISLGESLGVLAVIGMAIAVVAVVLVSREPGEHRQTSAAALVLALCSGVAIGLYLVVLGLAPAESGVWAATVGRWLSTVLVVGAVLAIVRPVRATPFPWVLAVAAGAMDAIANGVFQLAAQRGDLAVVAVIGSLYPAATVLLARIILRERMSRVQAVGVLLAFAAAAALSLPG